MPKKPRGKGYFAVALDMAIAESGLTMDEIERRCEEIGRPVSSVYIGRLRRGLMPPPSNEVSESIALALGICYSNVILLASLSWSGSISRDGAFGLLGRLFEGRFERRFRPFPVQSISKSVSNQIANIPRTCYTTHGRRTYILYKCRDE